MVFYNQGHCLNHSLFLTKDSLLIVVFYKHYRIPLSTVVNQGPITFATSNQSQRVQVDGSCDASSTPTEIVRSVIPFVQRSSLICVNNSVTASGDMLHGTSTLDRCSAVCQVHLSYFGHWVWCDNVANCQERRRWFEPRFQSTWCDWCECVCWLVSNNIVKMIIDNSQLVNNNVG